MTEPAAPPEPANRRLLVAWAGFCLLMVLVGVQEQLFDGASGLAWRVTDELIAMAVATAVVWRQWRRAPGADRWLTRPATWFWRALRALPLVALAFVATVYGLRHALRALFGLSHEHPPWPLVLGYESLKFGVFFVLFTAIQFGLRSHRALTAERLRAEQLLRLSDQARLQQLTQQVQPHFLFNALNTIASQIHADPDRADALLLQLASLLRATTDIDQRPQHRLVDELALARAYGGLMQHRFGDRVDLVWDVDATDAALGDTQVPVLALQPLLENSFVHGVERRRAPTHIVVRARRQGAHLRLEVSDDACSHPTLPAEGVGLGNLRARLQALYGDAASLAVQPRAGGGMRSVILLPAHAAARPASQGA